MERQGDAEGFYPCLIFFKSQPSRFGTEDARTAFILSLLTSKALAWADPLIRAQSPVVTDSQRLMNEMAIVFDHDITGQEAATRLTRLRQGSQSVAEFSIEFRALAGETGWNDGPLITLFMNALSDPVRDALAPFDPPASLGQLITTTIRIDNRVRERGREKADRVNWSMHSGLSLPVQNAGLSSAQGAEEPMQVDSLSFRSCLKYQQVRCYGCNELGHLRSTCPKRAKQGPTNRSKNQCPYCKGIGHTKDKCAKLAAKEESH